jgi:hypothetical protein
MPNWKADDELELIELGERVSRALDWESIGYGALFDLRYDKFMLAQAKEYS